MAKRVFISKNASETQELQSFLTARGDKLVSHSFLSFEQLPFELNEKYDVIFFGSPRGVIFFKSRCTIAPDTVIACTGNKTAELLSQLGYEVAFKGENSGDISTVASEFKAWCGSRKVLFPSSDISLKSISSSFPDAQKVELPVYKTIINSKTIEPCDSYVFTSPSNVTGFLSSNVIPENSDIIAWGESTAKALKENGLSVTYTLADSSIESLIDYLKQ